MSVFDELPQKLEVKRIPDNVLADGYDIVSAQDRALLKTSQVLVQAAFSEPKLPEEYISRSPSIGYEVHYKKTAAPWVLAFVGNNVNPARLASALTSARLAGIDDIAVAFLAQPEMPTSYVALDLCGIEHVLMLNFDEAAYMIEYASKHGKGRVILFGTPPGLAGTAFGLGIPFHDDKITSPAIMHGENLAPCFVDTNLPPDYFIDTIFEFSELQTDI